MTKYRIIKRTRGDGRVRYVVQHLFGGPWIDCTYTTMPLHLLNRVKVAHQSRWLWRARRIVRSFERKDLHDTHKDEQICPQPLGGRKIEERS